MKKLLFTFVIASVVFITGCKKDNYEAKVNECPKVVSTIPLDKAINVPLNQVISATFNVKMDPATITGASFTIQQGATIIASTKSAMVEPTVSYAGLTASLIPATPLSPFTLYTGRVTKSAKDLLGQALQIDHVWTFTTIPLLTLSSLPIAGGTTLGGGTIDQGAITTITATPNPGYAFLNWTENGAAVSTTSTYQFTMAGNRTLVANFTAQYAVTLLWLPLAGGTTTGGGTFNAGTSVTITAVPSVGYTFTNWTDAGIAVSPLKEYTFPLTISRILVANFAINMYLLKITPIPASGGTVAEVPNQITFSHGTNVQLTATPAPDYTFVSWSGDATGTANPLNVLMDADKDITANFKINTYTLTVNSAHGTVLKVPDQTTYNHGTPVVLTVTTVDEGYKFTGWTGSDTGTLNSLNITMTSPKTITANYIARYNVAVSSSPSGGGTTTGAGTFNSGASVTVTAVANADYTFTNWTEIGTPLSITTPVYTFNINGPRTLVANYTANVSSYLVTALINPATLSNKPTGGGTFNSGASVTVTAVANPDYTFTNWTDETGTPVSTSSSYTFPMPAKDRTLVANYTQVVVGQFLVTLSSIPPEGGTTSGGGTFSPEASVTVTAVANADYTFTNWTDETGTPVSTSSSYTFPMPAKDRTLVANYTQVVVGQFLVTLSSIPPEGGTTSGGGTFSSGTSVTVTATANNDYTFVNWTDKDNGTQVSTSSSYTFPMPAKDITLVANYTQVVSGPLAIDLGCAAPFAILAGSTITSTGPSIITGDVGLSPGTALEGFPPGTIIGNPEITTTTAAAAKLCLTAAFNDGQSRSLNAISLPGQLGGLTLAPGLYSNSSTSGISGTGANGILTLDAGGNANAVWIFQMGSTLKTDPATSIVLAGDAQAKNIFWIVGSSATLGTTSVFYGNILAQESITLNTGAVLYGRALTQTAAVTVDASTVTKP